MDGAGAYEDGLIDEQDAGVGFEVHPGHFLDDLESLDGDVRLVRQAQPHEVKHFVSLGGAREPLGSAHDA